VDREDRPVLRRNVRRSQLEAVLAQLPPTEVVMEACGGAHHWARVLQEQGHTVHLIPPQYVKPFVKRGKNDRNDAEAISEAAARPGMRFVPVKPAARQAEAMVLQVRELLVKQRTQLVNALRGHAAEFGVVAAKGTGKLTGLLAAIEADPGVPAAARVMLAFLGRQIERLDGEIGALDEQLLRLHKASPVSRLLAEIPGIGPIGAVSLSLTVDASQFRSSRHFAAWLGLVPKEHSTGGKQRLGGISRQGNERLRQLLVLGAMAVISAAARPGAKSVTPWLRSLLARRPRKVAAVALANKMARVVWAMMTSGEAYRPRSIRGTIRGSVTPTLAG
jgi:transposase